VLILPCPHRARPVSRDLDHAVDLILMTSLFIQAPLEFLLVPDHPSDFDDAAVVPQPCLDAADPVARHEGTDAAGHVIEAFGNFVMGGNFVIGIIVFAILVIVNSSSSQGFGAHRGSRGALPPRRHAGKQMAIDADLSQA